MYIVPPHWFNVIRNEVAVLACSLMKTVFILGKILFFETKTFRPTVFNPLKPGSNPGEWVIKIKTEPLSCFCWFLNSYLFIIGERKPFIGSEHLLPFVGHPSILSNHNKKVFKKPVHHSTRPTISAWYDMW